VTLEHGSGEDEECQDEGEGGDKGSKVGVEKREKIKQENNTNAKKEGVGEGGRGRPLGVNRAE